jgi:Flp pilus assembly protein TadD
MRSLCIVVALACLQALSACAGSAEQAAQEDVSAFRSEASNPYAFHRSVAYTLLETNQAMEATRVIRRMLDLKPDEVEPYCMLGRAYLDLRQLDSAERALKVALRKDDRSAQAHALLGVLLDTQGRSALAQAQHRRSIELRPKDAAYRNNLGFSLYLEGRYTRAIRAFKAALERDMAARRVHNNLAFAYSKVGDFGQAEAHFKLAGPPAQASNNLGFVFEERGEDERAYAYYVRALKEDPRLIPARSNLERVCKRLGRPMPEIKLPRAAPDRDPAGVEVSKVVVDAPKEIAP